MSKGTQQTETTEPSPAIAEIRAKISEIRDQLSLALHNHAQMLAEAHNVAVGDIVLWDGAEWRVTRLSLAITDRPYLHGVKRGRNGTFGSAERNIGTDWQKVSRT